MPFNQLVETVSKKPIPPHVKHLIVEVMVSDEEGEDVEVRFLFMHPTWLAWVEELTYCFFLLSGPIHCRAHLIGTPSREKTKCQMCILPQCS